VGRIVDRSHPRPVIGFGFSVSAIALTWLSFDMTPTTPIWRLVLALTAMGIGMAFIWSPLAATATRNLPAQLAGAGSGVYNTTRQVGSVLGSAGMAAFMTSRIGAEMPPMPTQPPQGEGTATRLPAFLHEPFAAAMSQSMLLPAFFALFGVVAALFLLGFGNRDLSAVVPSRADGPDDADRDAGYAVEYGGDEAFVDDGYVDDDEYVEYTISWDDEPEPEPERAVVDDESDTEPMQSRPEHLLHAPAETWRTGPVEAWHSLIEPEQPAPEPEQWDPEPEPPPAPRVEPSHESWRGILDELLGDVPLKPEVEPIGFAHNGFHVDDEQRFQPLRRPDPIAEPTSPAADAYRDDISGGDPSGSHARHEKRPSRHQRSEDEPQQRQFWFDSHGRHSRDDQDDASSYGRHSMPGRD
jgi:hypothetical protein